MLQPQFRLTTLFAIALFIGFVGNASAAVRIGEPAPAFTGADTQGKTHR
ncbi:MAG: hypothetical protein HC889_15320, partial [Synechococcaceae cyanobacterium SM1_2_3]|nr:hypothetical protein [Synechococcaceae cyanobacterium SM1_2_3]